MIATEANPILSAQGRTDMGVHMCGRFFLENNRKLVGMIHVCTIRSDPNTDSKLIFAKQSKLVGMMHV
jgi:hypothetical protein